MGAGSASRHPEEAGSLVKAACTGGFEALALLARTVTVAGCQPPGFLKVREQEKPV